MNLFVGNLNPDTTATSLRQLFSEFGTIVSAKIIIDNATGMSRGFGFVEMGDKIIAGDAIDNLDATFFEGNIISVKEAKQNSTKPTGPGGFKPAYNKPGLNRPATSYSKPAFKPRTPYPSPRPGIERESDDKYNRL